MRVIKSPNLATSQIPHRAQHRAIKQLKHPFFPIFCVAQQHFCYPSLILILSVDSLRHWMHRAHHPILKLLTWHVNGKFPGLPGKSDKYDQFTLPFSSIIIHKFQKYAKCQGRGKRGGGPKFLFNFLAFQTILENWPKIFFEKFSKSQILTKIDRHFWMPYLVTFLRFLRFLPWKIKVKRSLLTVYRFWKKLACLVQCP